MHGNDLVRMSLHIECEDDIVSDTVGQYYETSSEQSSALGLGDAKHYNQSCRPPHGVKLRLAIFLVQECVPLRLLRQQVSAAHLAGPRVALHRIGDQNHVLVGY